MKWRSPHRGFQSPPIIQTWWRKREGKNEIQTLWRKLRYYVFILRPSLTSRVWVWYNFIRTKKSGLFQGEDQIKGAGSHSSTELFFVYYRLTIKKYKIFSSVTFYTPKKPAEGENYFFSYERHIFIVSFKSLLSVLQGLQ